MRAQEPARAKRKGVFELRAGTILKNNPTSQGRLKESQLFTDKFGSSLARSSLGLIFRDISTLADLTYTNARHLQTAATRHVSRFTSTSLWVSSKADDLHKPATK